LEGKEVSDNKLKEGFQVSDKTETVTAFLARVDRVQPDYPLWRRGQVVYNCLWHEGFGATGEQADFVRFVDQDTEDPFHDDSRIPAFISAAVSAGVLREG
jgi:hypothetical protein